MRQARIKAEGGGYYHAMSRIIERRWILSESERETLVALMRRLAAFGGIEILAYAFLSNHFHILLYVPEPTPLSEAEFLKRLGHLYTRQQVALIAAQLHDCHERGESELADQLIRRYTYRMNDLSEFFKALKQRFSQTYNARVDRSGPLWEERFKSVLVEDSEHALLAISAYIELNAVRAGLTKDPKDYRHCSYGAAMGGDRQARNGLCRLAQIVRGGDQRDWADVQVFYRQRIYMQGQEQGLDPDGRPIRSGFTPQIVEQVIREGGWLPASVLLRCQVRYFSDGLALGGQAFVERVFARYRDRFGPKRRTGARPLRGGDWAGLCCLRNLRQAVLLPSPAVAA